MSIINAECETCGTIQHRYVRCDYCGREEKHDCINQYPANWFDVQIYTNRPGHPSEDYSLNKQHIRERHFCSVGCAMSYRLTEMDLEIE